MKSLPSYRPSHAACAAHVLRTRRMGLIPLFLSLLLMFAVRGVPGPGLWCAFGLSAGLHMMLWGAYAMVLRRDECTRIGRRLACCADLWFPGFLFFVQVLLAVVTVLILWSSLRNLGLPAGPAAHALLYILLALYPLHRLSRLAVQESESAGLQTLESCLRYFKRVVAALFIALTITAVARSDGGSISAPMLVAVVAAWGAAALVSLVGVTFILERLLVLRRGPPYSG